MHKLPKFGFAEPKLPNYTLGQTSNPKKVYPQEGGTSSGTFSMEEHPPLKLAHLELGSKYYVINIT